MVRSRNVILLDALIGQARGLGFPAEHVPLEGEARGRFRNTALKVNGYLCLLQRGKRHSVKHAPLGLVRFMQVADFPSPLEKHARLIVDLPGEGRGPFAIVPTLLLRSIWAKRGRRPVLTWGYHISADGRIVDPSRPVAFDVRPFVGAWGLFEYPPRLR